MMPPEPMAVPIHTPIPGQPIPLAPTALQFGTPDGSGLNPAVAHAIRSSSQVILGARDKHTLMLEGARRVLKYMFDLWQNNRLCDVILECKGGQRLSAHKVAMGAYSEMLSNKFQSYPVTELMTIDLREFSKEAVYSLLMFIYTTELHLNATIIKEVIACANELDFTFVKFSCINFINDNINVMTVFNFMDLASKYKLTETQNRLDRFLSEHFGEVINTDGFLSIKPDRLIRSLTEHKVGRKVGELAVFLAVVRWINYRLPERQHLAPSLFRLINFHMINPRDLVQHVQKVGYITQSMECFQMLYSAMAFHAMRSAMGGNDMFWPQSFPDSFSLPRPQTTMAMPMSLLYGQGLPGFSAPGMPGGGFAAPGFPAPMFSGAGFTPPPVVMSQSVAMPQMSAPTYIHTLGTQPPAPTFINTPATSMPMAVSQPLVAIPPHTPGWPLPGQTGHLRTPIPAPPVVSTPFPLPPVPSFPAPIVNTPVSIGGPINNALVSEALRQNVLAPDAIRNRVVTSSGGVIASQALVSQGGVVMSQPMTVLSRAAPPPVLNTPVTMPPGSILNTPVSQAPMMPPGSVLNTPVSQPIINTLMHQPMPSFGNPFAPIVTTMAPTGFSAPITSLATSQPFGMQRTQLQQYNVTQSPMGPVVTTAPVYTSGQPPGIIQLNNNSSVAVPPFTTSNTTYTSVAHITPAGNYYV